jgi:hypothetical protein
MKNKFSYVVIEDGKPICVADNFKYIRAYLDDYCGVSFGQGEFVRYEPHNSKYPDDYQGQFVYKDIGNHPLIVEEMIYFKVYLADVALPTKEQKRDDNIDEILNP